MIPPPPIDFVIPIRPRPTGNAHEIRRSGPRCPRCKQRQNTGVGRKASASRLKDSITLYAQAYAPRAPWNGPVRLGVTFLLEPPESWPDWKREAAAAGAILPFQEGTGDRDNLHKALADGLQAAGMFASDSAICGGPVAKRYAKRRGYAISIRFLPHGPQSAKEWRALQAASAETGEAIPCLVDYADLSI